MILACAQGAEPCVVISRRKVVVQWDVGATILVYPSSISIL
jgi:hypothetical protein